MRSGTLAGGIVMMVLGAIGYFALAPYSSDCGSFAGQLGRAFSSGYAQECQMVHLIQLGSIVFSIIGLGLTIGGAVASGSKSGGGLMHLREEYNAGYEETRPKPRRIDRQKQDNMKNISILKERLA